MGLKSIVYFDLLKFPVLEFLSMCFRNCVSHQERATVEQTTPSPGFVQASAIFTVSSEP